MRASIASKVFELENTFGLPHEDIEGGDDKTRPRPRSTRGRRAPRTTPTPTFGFSSDEAGSTFECSLEAQGDPASFGACSNPLSHTPNPGLADGDYTFAVRATDAASNTDTTPASQSFTVDTVLPSDPMVSSSSHQLGVASSDPTVVIGFSGATDGLLGSGVDGFSYQWSTFPTTLPDTTKDAEESATGTTSPMLADGSSHFFHLRTRDNAGNWTATVHLGPFVIDAVPDPGPSPPPAGAAADATPPLGGLSARAKRGGVIKLELRCDEACAALAGGVIVVGPSRFPLTKVRADVPATGSVIVKLVPKGKKAQRALLDLLASGTRGKAKIDVTFTDAAGNSAASAMKVKLKS